MCLWILSYILYSLKPPTHIDFYGINRYRLMPVIPPAVQTDTLTADNCGIYTTFSECDFIGRADNWTVCCQFGLFNSRTGQIMDWMICGLLHWKDMTVLCFIVFGVQKCKSIVEILHFVTASFVMCVSK